MARLSSAWRILSACANGGDSSSPRPRFTTGSMVSMTTVRPTTVVDAFLSCLSFELLVCRAAWCGAEAKHQAELVAAFRPRTRGPSSFHHSVTPRDARGRKAPAVAPLPHHPIPKLIQPSTTALAPTLPRPHAPSHPSLSLSVPTPPF